MPPQRPSVPETEQMNRHEGPQSSRSREGPKCTASKQGSWLTATWHEPVVCAEQQTAAPMRAQCMKAFDAGLTFDHTLKWPHCVEVGFATLPARCGPTRGSNAACAVAGASHAPSPAGLVGSPDAGAGSQGLELSGT